MPEPTVAPVSPLPKPRRSRWRRFFRWLGLLLLVFAVFHRPILLTAARLVLIKIAAKQNVDLQVHFSGTILTNLQVRDVHAAPNGKGKSPVEKIAIQDVKLEYSIPNLIRHGLGDFLHVFEIHHADLAFSGEPSANKEEKEQKKSLAETLNSMLGQPALYADIVRIEDFNLAVHSPGSTVEVKGIDLFFHPWEPGFLRIARISVPGLPAWENLAAETSYAQRNLYLKGLKLSPDLEIEEYNFDASQRAQNKGSMLLRVRAFGGSLLLTLAGDQLNQKGENLEKSYDTHLSLNAAEVDLQAAAAYFKAPAPPVKTLNWLKVNFAGEPERPRTWKGEAGLRVDALAFDKYTVDSAEVDSAFADGTAKVTWVHVATGVTDLTLQAQSKLPESVNDFQKSDADATFQLSAPELDALTKAFLPDAIRGQLTGHGKASLHQQHAAVDLELKAAFVENTDLGLGSASIQLHATKALESPGMAGLEARVTAGLQGLRYTTFTTDSAQLDAEAHNDHLVLNKLEVVRAENKVSAKGSYHLPQTGQPPSPIQGELHIDAPKLESFGLGKDGYILGGRLAASGKVTAAGDRYNGGLTIDGGDFTYGDFRAEKLEAAVAVVNNEATVEKFAFTINKTAQISLTGKAGVQAPFAYEGALLILFRDLAVLQPLLATFGVTESIGGALDFSAESQGKVQPQEHTGQMKLALTKAKYGATAIDEVGLAGLFGPNFAETTQLHAAMGATVFDAGLEWREDRLRLKDINLRQGAQQALTGFILLPFEPNNPSGPIPFEKRVAANVNANRLDLDQLLASLGKDIPASGIITANLMAGGSLLKPVVHLKVAGRNLQSKAAAQLKPSELDLNTHFSENQLTLDAEARVPEMQPLVIKGHVPLDLEAIKTQKKLDPNLPIDLTVRLPPSSLAFVSKLVPAVRSIAGTAGIDAHVTGTVDKPQWSGSAAVKLEYARLKNEGVPSIGALDIGLAFNQEALNVQRFRGEIGGGTFELGGKVGLAKLTEPSFDLHLKSDRVLVKRDDSVTVRVNSDIKVTGPMAAGKIAGTVWVVQSRFFRDIDILPLELPGRPKPKAKPEPKAVASQGGAFSLGPPLSGWTFDIAVKTKPEDPFRIQGNLANGTASVDLKFGGTGAKPFLEGSVRIDKLTASLPFSKLQITRGFVTFGRDEFAEPKLEIYAESQVRDYHINIFIFGDAKNPQVSMTSEPPLPQQDLYTLIATGVTTSELTENSDALASRAAVLLFQQVYHKIFKNKKPPENATADNRFSFDAGAVDSKTGRQEIAASFRIGEQTYLVGDVDIAGQFTGRVKYLLRFR